MKIAQSSVHLVDSMGSDLSVVNAARVSFNKESEWEDNAFDVTKPFLSDKDAKLIAYLAKHGHWSPFAHNSLTFRIKAPIFCARQMVKHQVGGVWNEVSRRYVDDEPEFYIPTKWRKAAINVKQGSSQEEFTQLVKTGSCLYCGNPLTGAKTKYCCDAHQRLHWNERNIYSVRFARWRATAKATNIPFSITESDLDWPKQCSYLEMELNYSSDDRADNVASLDKIIPELGYIPGNVQIISQLANKMKSSANKEQLLLFAKNAALQHGGIFMDMSSSYESFLEKCSESYHRLISDGLAPEQARIFMPQSMFTEWWWTGSLMFFARVCKQRLDPHAQQETREIAELIAAHIPKEFEHSWKALMENKT